MPSLEDLAAQLGVTTFGAEGSQTPAPAPQLPVHPTSQPWKDRYEGTLRKVSYTHDAMIDLMISCPMISQADLAAHFGYSQTWVSQIINSDAFQSRLRARKSELTDPVIVQSIEERVSAAAQRSLDIVLEKLETGNAEYALKVAQTMLAAKGFGARTAGQGSGPQVAVVVNVPQKAESPEAWASKYEGTTARSAVVDVTPREPGTS